ncbi:hypothetical protein Tco_0616768, partial [Tanacetum coccineum]
EIEREGNGREEERKRRIEREGGGKKWGRDKGIKMGRE